MSDKITIEEVREFFKETCDRFPDSRSDTTIRGSRNLLTLEQGAKVASFAIKQHEELTRLRAQLQERDAQLAECIKGFEKIDTVLLSLAGQQRTTKVKSELKDIENICTEIRSSLPATAQANAKIILAAEEQEREFNAPNGVGEYILACSNTNQAVRDKKALKP
jgi:hypothetical protein